MTHRSRVAAIGLGPMGGAIAARVADLRDVVGIDIDPARAAAWQVSTGSPSVSVYEELEWDTVRCMIVAVRTPSQVEDVLAESGVRSALDDDGSALIVTTLPPSFVRGLLARHRAWRLIELPVSGGSGKAREGELTGLVAGPQPDAFESAVLGDVFSKVFTFEEVGQPSLLKLLNNGLAAQNLLGAAQALLTAHQHGVDAHLAGEILNASSAQSLIGEALGRLSPNDADLLRKDTDLLVQDLGTSPFDATLMTALPELFAAAWALLNRSGQEEDQ